MGKTQVSFYESFRNQILCKSSVLAQGQAVQQRRGVVPPVELLQNIVFRISSPPSLIKRMRKKKVTNYFAQSGRCSNAFISPL